MAFLGIGIVCQAVAKSPTESRKGHYRRASRLFFFLQGHFIQTGKWPAQCHYLQQDLGILEEITDHLVLIPLWGAKS